MAEDLGTIRRSRSARLGPTVGGLNETDDLDTSRRTQDDWYRRPAFRGGPAWLTLLSLLVGAALVVGYFLLPTTELQDFAYQVPEMIAAVAVLAGVAIHRPHNRWPWLLLAAGLTLTAVGDWTWIVLDRVFGIEPFPSVADLFYLGGMGLTVAAVVWMVRGRIPDGDRGGVLDALIVAVGVGLVSWTFLMAPIASRSERGDRRDRGRARLPDARHPDARRPRPRGAGARPS